MKSICFLTLLITTLCHGRPNVEGLTREEDDPTTTTIKSAPGLQEDTTTKAPIQGPEKASRRQVYDDQFLQFIAIR